MEEKKTTVIPLVGATEHGEAQAFNQSPAFATGALNCGVQDLFLGWRQRRNRDERRAKEGDSPVSFAVRPYRI